MLAHSPQSIKSSRVPTEQQYPDSDDFKPPLSWEGRRLPGFPPHLHQVSPDPSTDVLLADQVHLRPGEFLPADHCHSGQEAALTLRAGGGGGGGHQEVLGFPH